MTTSLPRGMGVRFVDISDQDRKVIAKEILQHLKSENVGARALEVLQTIATSQDEIGSGSA
jgi:hypothetical protein